MSVSTVTAVDQGFPRSARLLRGSEFQAVFAKPCARVGGAALLLLARPNALEQARLGLAISRKHAARAVLRNRIKRLVRESFRRHRRQLAGLDIVVLSRGAVSGLTPGQLTEQLEHYWPNVIARCATSSAS